MTVSPDGSEASYGDGRLGGRAERQRPSGGRVRGPGEQSATVSWQATPLLKAAATKKSKMATERRRRRRLGFLVSLGGQCVECGFSDPRALEVDHINGGGTQARSKVGDVDSYHHLLTADAAAGRLQLLCANCHRIKDHERLYGAGTW